MTTQNTRSDSSNPLSNHVGTLSDVSGFKSLFGIKLIETHLAAEDVCILIGRPDNHLIAGGRVMGFMPGTDQGVIGTLNFKTGDMQWLKGHIIEEIRGTAPTIEKLKKLIDQADTQGTDMGLDNPEAEAKA